MATAGSSRRSRPGFRAANGRTEMDVASLADLLHETSGRHGAFEAVAPPHDWWDWYAAYMDARQSGSDPDEASTAANRYMADVKHIVVPSAEVRPAAARRGGHMSFRLSRARPLTQRSQARRTHAHLPFPPDHHGDTRAVRGRAHRLRAGSLGALRKQ